MYKNALFFEKKAGNSLQRWELRTQPLVGLQRCGACLCPALDPATPLEGVCSANVVIVKKGMNRT